MKGSVFESVICALVAREEDAARVVLGTVVAAVATTFALTIVAVVVAIVITISNSFLTKYF